MLEKSKTGKRSIIRFSLCFILTIPFLSFANEDLVGACQRPLEYKIIRLLNEVSEVNEDDNYESIIDLGKHGSAMRANPEITIASILARDVLVHSSNDKSFYICDKPNISDVRELANFIKSKRVHIRMLDIKAMLDMTLEYDSDYLIKNKNYADFKDAFSLMLFYLSKDENRHPFSLINEQFYAKKYLDFLQSIYDFRESFLEYLNPNILVWNRFEKLKNSSNVNKAIKNREERYSEFMFSFLRQIQTFNPGFIVYPHSSEFPSIRSSSVNFDKQELDAKKLVFVNPKLLDFARLRKYQSDHRLSNKKLRQSIIRIAEKIGNIYFGEIVDELYKEKVKDSK